MKKILYAILGLGILTLAGCLKKKKPTLDKPSSEIKSILPVDQTTPITIFVHGTLPQFLRPLISSVDLDFGFFRADELADRKWIIGKVAWWAHQGDPEQFPLNSTYLYGWTGGLSFKERERAAEELYLLLRDYKGPITVIGHSHGGNVGLLLAQVAEKHNDSHFKIDRLVLSATPIQAVTAPLIGSSTFKQVYSLYSKVDMIQVGDPQKLYAATKQLNNDKVPFFSERIVKEYYPNLIQARISTGSVGPGHMTFILPTFLHRLGSVLRLLGSVAYKAQIHNGPRHVRIIVIEGKPVQVDKNFVD